MAVDYPEIKESITPQKLMELKEKAEKWDLADKIGPPPHGDKRIQWHIDMSELRLKLEAVKNFWDYLLTTAFKDATVEAIWSEKRGMAVDISLWLHDELEEWNKQHPIKILEAET